MRGDVTLWGLAFLWGVVLGLFYFGGLWMTLKTMPGKKWPKRRLAVSYPGACGRGSGRFLDRGSKGWRGASLYGCGFFRRLELF